MSLSGARLGERLFAVSRSPLFAVVVALSGLPACKEQTPPPPQNTQASPNASILPAPLASAGELVRKNPETAGSTQPVGIPADSAGRLIVVEPEAPPPQPISVNEPLPRDYVTSRDGVGITLTARWVWADLPPRPPIPELSVDGLKAAADRTDLTVTVDLAYVGRMRFRPAWHTRATAT
jgi:hypothetical protein